MSPKLTADKIARAQKMRELDWSWRQIGAYLNVGPDTVRGALDPAHRVKVKTGRVHSEQIRRALRTQKTRRVRVKANLSVDPGQLTPSVFLSAQISIPDGVLIDRDRRAQLEHESLTAALLGDPLPGRSALDRRGPRVVENNG